MVKISLYCAIIMVLLGTTSVNSTYLTKFLEFTGMDLGDPGVAPGKFDHLHEFKWAKKNLAEKCIKFHDSEIVSVDLKRASGRWDRHLISMRFSLSYDYAIAEYKDETDVLRFSYFPMNLSSQKTVRNDSKILRGVLEVSDMFGIAINHDEAMIAIDYDKFFFKYTCVDINGDVSGSLHLQLRPEITKKLETNPDIFAEIIDKIPEKSLVKISKLIGKLFNQNDNRFDNFGEEYLKTLTQRLDNYRKAGQLSNKTDEEIFQFLEDNCLKFDEQEIPLIDLSQISSNWTLDQLNGEEKLPYNRLDIKRKSEITFDVKLYNDDKLVAESDHYFDNKNIVFWSFTEGRRSREVYLLLNSDYRVVYSCDEQEINGNLKTNENLRFFSSVSTTQPHDRSKYMELLAKHLSLKTLEKLTKRGVLDKFPTFETQTQFTKAKDLPKEEL